MSRSKMAARGLAVLALILVATGASAQTQDVKQEEGFTYLYSTDLTQTQATDVVRSLDARDWKYGGTPKGAHRCARYCRREGGGGVCAAWTFCYADSRCHLLSALPASLEAALPPAAARLGRHGHVFVIMTEVLDNLPHDRVERARGGSSGGGGRGQQHDWMETLVVPRANASSGGGGSGGGAGGRQSGGSGGEGEWAEALRPLQDPLIARCLDAVMTGGGGDGGNGSGGGAVPPGHSWIRRLVDAALGTAGAPEAAFLPTGALALLEALHAARPRHTLLAADFDALPDVRIAGANAPLVSGRAGPGGRPRDYGSVLAPWGAADIFFPTDFEWLGRLYRRAAAGAAAAGGSGSGSGSGSGNGAAAAGGAGGAAGGGAAAAAPAVTYRHMTTAQFVQGLGLSRATQTLSGWNPLLQDWPNTRVAIATRGAPAAGSGGSSGGGGGTGGAAAGRRR